MTRVNIDEAIDKAAVLFWGNGYGATTMRQLQHAMDMRPGSIYGAFGDKDTLYLKTLDHYRKASLLRMQTTMASAQSAWQGLQKTIEQAIFGNEDAPSELCFLVKTVNELETRQPELVSFAKSALLDIRDELEKQTRLVLAEQGKGEAEIDAEAQGLATIIQAQIMGMKAQLKLTQQPDLIAKLIMQFMRNLFNDRVLS
ncbi:TetR/AcrR family transcriptional regulator [Planctobacterium marinum]|uniref:TetR family transcriptional regulator n=1 Tax=Planctobacterium marinum TaxID=1631968 RepID=A0AA48I6C2_9ALTE|nr:TetR family transcriptional regulator [Planctobacterium marinum]